MSHTIKTNNRIDENTLEAIRVYGPIRKAELNERVNKAMKQYVRDIDIRRSIMRLYDRGQIDFSKGEVFIAPS